MIRPQWEGYGSESGAKPHTAIGWCLAAIAFVMALAIALAVVLIYCVNV